MCGLLVVEEEKHPADEEDKNSAGEKYKIQWDRFDFFDPSLVLFWSSPSIGLMQLATALI
jgi:hypothetical protein